MARIKRTSAVLETARQRLAGLKSISPLPDFGPGMTIADFEADIDAVSDLVDSYNEALAAIDQLQNRLQTRENGLRDKSGRYLAMTKGRYGGDSSEYEVVGGTRQSERKRPGPRTPKQKLATA